MRERLFQLLPEIGVIGVTGVPEGKNSWKHCIHGEDTSGTSPAERGVTAVPATPGKAVRPVRQNQNDLYQQKPNKISVGTPVTPGTPVFTQDFIEAYEERAAIMEFNTGISRQDAEAAAFEDCMALYEGRKQ